MFIQIIIFLNVLYVTVINLAVHSSDLQCQLLLQCIPLKNCDSLKTLIKTSENMETTFKFLRSHFCGSHHESEMKVCCPDVVSSHKSIKKQLRESPCKPTFQCISLMECGPLKGLLDKEKPATKGVVKFIKAQQCGVGVIYPKVCCKENAKSKEVDEKVVLTTERIVSTTERIVSTTEMVGSTTKSSLIEKSEAINKAFNGDFDDFMFYLL